MEFSYGFLKGSKLVDDGPETNLCKSTIEYKFIHAVYNIASYIEHYDLWRGF